MKKNILPLVALLLFCCISTGFAQQKTKNLLSMLHLSESDLPEGYQFSEVLACKTSKLNSFYKNVNNYSDEIGQVAFKGFQSIESDSDKGSILYFQFQDPKGLQNFLNDYLWGKEGKASEKRPDEYMILAENFLILWSVNLDSPIKGISKLKIEQLK